MATGTSETRSPPRFQVTPEYIFTVISAWLLPGSGHWFLGHRARGMVLGGAILGIFWLGEVMAIPPPGATHPRRPIAVTREVHPIFFFCQAGNGFSTLLANTLWGKPLYEDRGARSDEPDAYLPHYLNLAILLTSVSGLLNYLLVLHIMDPRTWAEREAQRSREGPP